jgi:hypothetical protein
MSSGMGTDPYRYKMPNRNLGKEIGEEKEEPKDVNTQKVATDPHTGNKGLETNFSHMKKAKAAKQ